MQGLSRGNRIHAVGAGWQTASAAWQVVAAMLVIFAQISQRKLAPLIEELLFGFLFLGFTQRDYGCGFAVPVNFVPESFAVPAHDFERAD